MPGLERLTTCVEVLVEEANARRQRLGEQRAALGQDHAARKAALAELAPTLEGARQLASITAVALGDDAASVGAVVDANELAAQCVRLPNGHLSREVSSCDLDTIQAVIDHVIAEGLLGVI
jgi:hypothetical protein